MGARRSQKRAGRTRARAFRLEPGVRPTAAAVRLELDPARGEDYSGEVTYELELAGRRRRIELHAADLRVSRARVHAGGRARRGRVVRHPERESVVIELAESVPAGPARLELFFRGRLRRDLRGLYLVESGGRRFAFSQLAPASARRCFPCFDEPGSKARYTLAVTTGARQHVLANSPVQRIERAGDGRRTWHFDETPPLSSYLLAVAVGPLVSSPAVFCGSTEIRAWHVPGREGLADFALEAARESLWRLESWFDLPYPYAKLDLVAVPDFEFGAMENPGAVFFRETLLLLDPAASTLPERRRAAEVIAHELAHMWYGNLVTMAWWDDLWLNEAFATWMAFEILERWRPDWRIWQAFLHQRSAALDLDALASTHPVYTPVRTPDEAAASFDVITYEKGAAVIRMLERFLGPEIFCAGVRKYIREHREGTTVAADLWRALSEVSGEDVARLARAWIEQPGHPLLQLRRVERDGRSALALRQERFYLLPPRTRDRGRWPIPFVARIGEGVPGRSHAVRHLLRRVREVVEAPGADLTFVYGNAEEAAFLQVEHDPQDVEDVIQDLESLSPLERQGFVDHLWALVRAGRSSMASLLDLLAALGSESDPDVLEAARRPLAILARRLAPDLGAQVEARLRAWIEVYYGAQVDELGFDVRPGEDERTRQRRAEVLDIVGRIGRASAVLETAAGRCRHYLDERSSLDPSLADAVVSLAAARGDDGLHQRLVAAMQGAATPQEQRRFLLALGDFAEPSLVARSLELTLGDRIATQDVAFLLIRLLENRDARQATWRFMQRRWARLRKRMGPLLVCRVIDATPALASRAQRREVAAFFAAHPVPAGARSLRQALERFDWYEAYRRRAGPQLEAYLSGR